MWWWRGTGCHADQAKRLHDQTDGALGSLGGCGGGGGGGGGSCGGGGGRDVMLTRRDIYRTRQVGLRVCSDVMLVVVCGGGGWGERDVMTSAGPDRWGVEFARWWC